MAKVTVVKSDDIGMAASDMCQGQLGVVLSGAHKKEVLIKTHGNRVVSLNSGDIWLMGCTEIVRLLGKDEVVELRQEG